MMEKCGILTMECGIRPQKYRILKHEYRMPPQIIWMQKHRIKYRILATFLILVGIMCLPEPAEASILEDRGLVQTGSVQTAAGSYDMGTEDNKTSDLMRNDLGIEDLQQDIMSELSLDEIDDVLEEYESTRSLSFSDLFKQVLQTQNDGQDGKKDLFRRLFGILFADISGYKKIFVQILLLTIAFSFLNNFINIFENSQISKTGFYMFFLILMVLLMKSYLLLNDTLLGVTEQITDFMQALLPAFCMTMVFASANMTAASFYQITLTVIWLVERILLYIIIPGIHVYAVLQMLNHMTEGRLISRWTRLIKRVIVWSLRALLAGVTGINIVENVIAPSMDNLQKLSVTKTLGMIPGLGGTAEAVGSILIGSAAVIKNGIGVTAMIILLVICLGPMLKLLLFALFYRVAGAVVQPFADRRACDCIDSVGDAAGLLCRTLVTGVLLFLISIAVVLTAVR